MLALALIATFFLMICIGIVSSVRNILRSAQQKEKEFEERYADMRRRVGGHWS